MMDPGAQRGRYRRTAATAASLGWYAKRCQNWVCEHSAQKQGFMCRSCGCGLKLSTDPVTFSRCATSLYKRTLEQEIEVRRSTSLPTNHYHLQGTIPANSQKWQIVFHVDVLVLLNCICTEAWHRIEQLVCSAYFRASGGSRHGCG